MLQRSFPSSQACHTAVFDADPHSAVIPTSPSESALHLPDFGALYLPPQRPWYTLAPTPLPITPHSEFSSLELPISLSTSPAASDAPSLSNASSDTESAFGDLYEPASASSVKLSLPQGIPVHAPSYASPGFSPNVGYFPPLPSAPAAPKLDRPPLPRRTTYRKAMAYRCGLRPLPTEDRCTDAKLAKPCRYWTVEQTCPKGNLCTLLVPCLPNSVSTR